MVVGQTVTFTFALIMINCFALEEKCDFRIKAIQGGKEVRSVRSILLYSLTLLRRWDKNPHFTWGWVASIIPGRLPLRFNEGDKVELSCVENEDGNFS